MKKNQGCRFVKEVVSKARAEEKNMKFEKSMWKKIMLSLLLAPMLMGCNWGEQQYVFPEPVVRHLADPFVLTASDGVYYMYGTSTNEGGVFRAWSSTDLENWQSEGIVFYYRRGDWAYTHFWAPEVVERDGRFYMFYTARERSTNRLHIGLAVSDSPLGPFVDERQRPLLNVNYAVIDAHVFIDDDGRIFMYYSRDCSENVVNGIHRSDIYVVELDEDFEQKGDPIFLFSPTQEWETKDVQLGWLWVEGPSVIKIGDTYYMTYSGNPYYAFEYAIGVATSDSPTGPFEKYEGNPVVQGDMEQNVSGTGHNSIFRSQDGERIYIAYHIHMNPTVGGGSRKVLISQVEFIDGTMRLIPQNER